MNYNNNGIINKNILNIISKKGKEYEDNNINTFDSFNYNKFSHNYNLRNQLITGPTFINNNYEQCQNNINNNVNINFNYVNGRI